MDVALENVPQGLPVSYTHLVFLYAGFGGNCLDRILLGLALLHEMCIRDRSAPVCNGADRRSDDHRADDSV